MGSGRGGIMPHLRGRRVRGHAELGDCRVAFTMPPIIGFSAVGAALPRARVEVKARSADTQYRFYNL